MCGLKRRPAYAQLHGAVWFEAAADAMQGQMQGAALDDEQAGELQPADGWRLQLPARQNVLDRLSLLLCSRELLGHVID